jgi:SprT protein
MDINLEPLEDDFIVPSEKTIAEVNGIVKRCLDILGDRFQTTFATPEIKYDLEGRTAGQAIGTHTIRLNLTLLRENRQDMLENTLPHEIAHCVVAARYPRAKAHGYEWERVMRLLGLSPTRCHNYETTPARIHKKFEHHCLCPEPHLVGSAVHNRILAGKYYYCRKCKARLR